MWVTAVAFPQYTSYECCPYLSGFNKYILPRHRCLISPYTRVTPEHQLDTNNAKRKSHEKDAFPSRYSEDRPKFA